MRLYTRSFVILACCLGLFNQSVQAHGGKPHTPTRAEVRPLSGDELEIRLQTGQHYEECRILKKGHRWHYQFNSDLPIDFDLHTHRNGGLQFIENKKALSKHQARYSATRNDEYCLTWHNAGKTTATFKVKMSIIEPK